MGQTGITSAVGLTLESAFASVPLTLASGTVYGVGIAASNPNRFCIVEPSGGVQGEPEIDVSEEVDGDVQQRRLTLVGKWYGGDLRFKADPENLYYPLLGMFGRDSQTLLHAVDSTHSPAAYSHLFQPGKTIPSFTVEEDLGTGVTGRLASGVLVPDIEIDFGRILTCKVTLSGHEQIPNTYPVAGVPTDFGFGAAPGLLPAAMGGDGTKQVQATAAPVYVDVAQGQSGDGPLVFAGLTFGTKSGFSAAYLLVNGVAVANLDLLEGSKLKISRKIDSRRKAGSGFSPRPISANKFLVSGTLMATYSDSTIPATALKFGQVALDLLFVGAAIGTSGYSYSLEIHLPHVKLTKAPVGLTAETMLISADFTACKDVTAGYTVQLTLQNTVNNTNLGGQQAPACVTTALMPNNTITSIPVNTSAGYQPGDSLSIANATGNPYTVASLPDSAHITTTGLVQGNVPAGSAITNLTRMVGPGGLGGWQNS